MNEPTTQPSPEQARSAAAAIVAPDPLTAELLAKHAAGERLSQSQYGKLGALAAKTKKFFGMGDAPGQPSASGNGNAARVAPVAPAQASADSLPAVAPDSGLVQRTTGALLARAENFAKRKLTNAAQAAGADGKAMARFERAANLPPDDKELLIELSPDVARELGVDPRNYPLVVFFGVIGLWTSEVWLAIDELKQMKAAKDKPVHGATPQTAAPAVTLAQSLTPPAPMKGPPPLAFDNPPPKVT